MPFPPVNVIVFTACKTGRERNPMKLLLFAVSALPALLAMCCTHVGAGSSAAAKEKTAGPAKETAQRELEALLEPIRAQHDLPTLAAAVIREGKIVAVGAVGVRKYGSDA